MSAGLSIQFIEINKYVFLFYKNSIEVYELSNNILILKYIYNTKDYKYFNCNKLYVVDIDTLILDDYPSLIIKGQTSYICKDNEEDILINNENIITNSKLIKNIKDSPITSTTKTVKLVDNLKTTFIIDSINEENIFSKFDEEVLDKYRKFYYELVTTNESLALKKDKLQELYTKINKKIKSQEERKNHIKLRLEEVAEKYEKMLSKVKIDGKSIYNYINILKNLLEKDKKCYEEKFLKILKIQNNFLKKKIFKQY